MRIAYYLVWYAKTLCINFVVTFVFFKPVRMKYSIYMAFQYIATLMQIMIKTNGSKSQG